jgi:hypothetical protein
MDLNWDEKVERTSRVGISKRIWEDNVKMDLNWDERVLTRLA